ncbi:growth hormone secretagogue receptor type 1 isoform X1 [Pogona vitticeps]
MLAVVVVAFVLCWLPLHVGRILFAQGNVVLYEISQYFNLVSMMLFYLGASVNPVLYNVMSQKHRKAVCKFLHRGPLLPPRHLSRSGRTRAESAERQIWPESQVLAILYFSYHKHP